MNDQYFSTSDSEVRLFLILAAALSIILLASVIFDFGVEREDNSRPSEVVSSPFPEVKLGAKATYVYDIRTQTVLFAKNENIRLPLASLAKIMSALVAEDSSPPYGVVTVSGKALEAQGDSGLLRDERWALRDILDFSLLTSSNDGMRAVALSLGALSRADATPEEIINDFVGEMNRKAQELGLKNTYFGNETGLDQSVQAGEPKAKGSAYGTARDMSALVEYILSHHPALFTATRETATALKSLDNHSHVAKNTNILVAEIPGLLASKTGFTDIAGGNLVVVFDPELGRPIIISILGSTEEGRFKDARTLIDAIMEYIQNN